MSRAVAVPGPSSGIPRISHGDRIGGLLPAENIITVLPSAMHAEKAKLSNPMYKSYRDLHVYIIEAPPEARALYPEAHNNGPFQKKKAISGGQGDEWISGVTPLNVVTFPLSLALICTPSSLPYFHMRSQNIRN